MKVTPAAVCLDGALWWRGSNADYRFMNEAEAHRLLPHLEADPCLSDLAADLRAALADFDAQRLPERTAA